MWILNFVDVRMLKPLFAEEAVFCNIEQTVQYIAFAICHARGSGDAVLAVSQTQHLHKRIGADGLPDFKGRRVTSPRGRAHSSSHIRVAAEVEALDDCGAGGDMLTQVKLGLGLDLDVFAHQRVVGGQFFVDEGFVGDHFWIYA